MAKLHAQAQARDPLAEQLAEAREMAENGRFQTAQDILLALVESQPQYEPAWWELSQIVNSLEDQIIALENVLQINPNHEAAQERLTQLQASHQDHLALGRRYEEQGDLDKAITAYTFAAKQSPVNADRLIAKKRLEAAQKQQKLADIKLTGPSITWARLAIGPPLLFGLLIFLQSGLNPLRFSPLNCLGGVGVIAGSLLVAGGGQRAAPSLLAAVPGAARPQSFESAAPHRPGAAAAVDAFSLVWHRRHESARCAAQHIYPRPVTYLEIERCSL